jgi:hypothetical protein
MSFVCCLSPEHQLVLTNIHSEHGQGETIIRIPIGTDSVTGAVFSVFVCLATEPGYGPLRHELVFHVVKAEFGEEDVYFQDGLETRGTITNSIDRQMVLQAICIATQMLIDQVAPVEVVIATHEANLPPRALAKYGRIGSVFVNRGYVPAHPDPYHGIQIWMFTQP